MKPNLREYARSLEPNGVRRTPRARSTSGFTLIELSIVMFIIAIVAAVAFPQFLPILSFSQLEGAGRHVANYSRAAIAQAALTKDDITYYFDLNKQEFWCTKMVYPAEQGEGEAESDGQDQMALLGEFQQQGGYTGAEMSKLMRDSRGKSGLSGGLSGLPNGFDPDMAGQQVGDKFDRMARKALEERAKNVIQDDSIMDQMGPLFDKKFSLDNNGADEEPYEEEIADTVLQRSGMPSDVTVTDIYINGKRNSKGVVSIPISPLGLQDDVVFYLTNAEGNSYSVIWDPALNNVDILDGKAAI